MSNYNRIWLVTALLTFGSEGEEVGVRIQRLVSAPADWGRKLVWRLAVDYLREVYTRADGFTLEEVVAVRSCTAALSRITCLDARTRTTCQLTANQVADALESEGHDNEEPDSPATA